MQTIDKYIKYFILLSALILLLPAVSSAATAKILELSEELDGTYAGEYLEFVTDASGQKSLAEILSVFEGGKVFTREQTIPTFRYTDEVYWGKIQFKNELPADYCVTIEHGFVATDRIEIFTLVDGAIIDHQIGGDRVLQVDKTTLQGSDGTFRITVPPQSKGFFLIRIQTESLVKFNFRFFHQLDYLLQIRNQDLLKGGFYGLMLALLFYNLFLFFSIREKVYTLYILVLITHILARLVIDGYAGSWFWPDNLWLKNRMVHISSVILPIAALEFTRVFLDIKARFKWINYLFHLSQLINLFYLISALWGSYRFTGTITPLIFLTSSAVILVAVIASFVRWNRAILFYAPGWLMFISGVILYVMEDHFTGSSQAKYAVHIGTAAEVILFSFGLGDRYNRIKKRLAEETQKLLDQEKNFSRRLNQEVEEKTADLKRALELEEENQASNRDMYAMIAHQLRTPVTVIRLYADFLIRGKKCTAADEAQKKYVDIIEKNNNQIESITNDILFLLNLETDDQEGDDSFSNITGTIDAMIEKNRHLFTSQRNLITNLNHEEKIVSGSEQAMYHILDNFLVNAAKYGGDQDVEIRSFSDEYGVTLLVQDKGPGIPDEEKTKVFQRFYRLSSDRSLPGTGIGLYVARKFAEKSGAHIGVRDCVEGGSIFWTKFFWATERKKI